MLIIIGSNLLKLASSIHINIYVIIENYFDHEKKSEGQTAAALGKPFKN